MKSKDGMAPSRDKFISIFISLALIIIPTHILLSLISKQQISPSDALRLYGAAIAALNIAILFAWYAQGTAGGILASAIAVVAALWLVLKMAHHYGSLLLIATFFPTNLLGYICSKTKESLISQRSLNLEKLEESINLLSESIGVRKKEAVSLGEKLRRYAVLKEAAESLSTTLLLNEVTRPVIEKTPTVIGKSGRVLIFLVDMESQELMLSASSDNLRILAKKGDIYDLWALRHRRSLIANDITKDFRFPSVEIEKTQEFFRSLIIAPLVSEHKTIGLLRMDSMYEGQFTQDDLRLLDIISGLAATAIQNTRLYSRTQELAIRDGLTGLLVRRYFLSRFQEEVHRAARSKAPLTLIFLDIDHYKSFNDRFGHAAGDLVLKHLARIISSMTKEGDIPGRYGGEEIALLNIGMGKPQASNFAEALRRRVKKEPFILRRQRHNITISIGLSNYPDDAVSVEDLIRIADERLYKAKEDGRDRVCSG
ncbi:MAG: hypothetical protein A2987_06225 [Omnitrophica bacterium RIFCSPLOWO2_01_FULL_45_10]|nr:MAG: hypothetical protein A2987_06225 [Omnitrophica bacterium RIFCSPLOWO2_01_FULL_45_10]